ncbi:MAG: hypothetical protein NXI11_11640, partial [Proteobacteria bacterium]|nr:hypothetical protein [Pseudomonadota bacterium]
RKLAACKLLAVVVGVAAAAVAVAGLLPVPLRVAPVAAPDQALVRVVVEAAAVEAVLRLVVEPAHPLAVVQAEAVRARVAAQAALAPHRAAVAADRVMEGEAAQVQVKVGALAPGLVPAQVLARALGRAPVRRLGLVQVLAPALVPGARAQRVAVAEVAPERARGKVPPMATAMATATATAKATETDAVAATTMAVAAVQTMDPAMMRGQRRKGRTMARTVTAVSGAFWAGYSEVVGATPGVRMMIEGVLAMNGTARRWSRGPRS